MTEQNQQLPEENLNQAKEITVLRRNLRLLKRMILGNKKPPFFLRMMCVINFFWSSVMILYYGVLALIIMLKGQIIKGGYFDELVKYGSKLYFGLVILHFIAILGAVLMYRQKKFGFYVFSFASLLMPFYMLVYVNFSQVLIMFASSVVMIGLFALNYKTLGLHFRSTEKSES